MTFPLSHHYPVIRSGTGLSPESSLAPPQLSDDLQHKPNAPKFGFKGPLELIASGAQKIDSSPLLELFMLDFVGMVIPRSSLEASQRGFDMGRETLFREMAGLLTNVLLAGWLGLLATTTYNGKLLNNHLFRTNKLGLNTGAWINAKSLDMLEAQFHHTVNHAKPTDSATSIRQQFIKNILKSLHSTDSKTATNNLKTLFNKPEAENKLTQALQQNLQQHIKKGTLTTQGFKELMTAFAQSPMPSVNSTHTMTKGTFRLYEELARIRKQLNHDPHLDKEAHQLLDKPPRWLQKVAPHDKLRKARQHLIESKILRESLKLSKEASKASEKQLDQWLETAFKHNLTSNVNVNNQDGKAVLEGVELKRIFRETKFFLEHYVDRAFANKETGALSKNALSTDAKTHALKALSRLTQSTRKSKTWLTTIPYIITALLSVSVAPLNNWLTKQRHGGKVFYPGDGGPQLSESEKNTKRLLAAADDKHPNHPQHATTLRPRVDGAFSIFEQQQRERHARRAPYQRSGV